MTVLSSVRIQFDFCITIIVITSFEYITLIVFVNFFSERIKISVVRRKQICDFTFAFRIPNLLLQSVNVVTLNYGVMIRNFVSNL